ncbi:fasciclin domain-containing protein [Sphingomonas sp. ASV193]|uniref:fasciclin domain-containing protein n=1 Tax=Sphingomonas sp. ASV193 TaxID=3144405 RepID=UPI0032E8D06F
MKRRTISIRMSAAVAAMALAVAGCATNSMAPMADGSVPMVGGAPMYPTRTIVQNASSAPNLTTLVSAVKEAGLVDTLSGPGPFTVFAPTNDAFAMVPSATLNSLMMPANKAQLVKVLTYHVIPGRLSAADLMARINAGGGSTTITTVEGEPLTFTTANGMVMIRGMGGSMATVTMADVNQSNGVVHVIDHVLLPSM